MALIGDDVDPRYLVYAHKKKRKWMDFNVQHIRMSVDRRSIGVVVAVVAAAVVVDPSLRVDSNGYDDVNDDNEASCDFAHVYTLYVRTIYSYALV